MTNTKNTACQFALLAWLSACCASAIGQPVEEPGIVPPDLEYLRHVEMPKHALVIYAEDYEYLARVTNALNDATQVQRSLQALGFNVETVPNPTGEAFFARVKDFVDRALALSEPSKAVVVLYFAGHGFHAGTGNFIVPVDAHPANLVAESIPVSYIVNKLTSGPVALSLILLDACRTELRSSSIPVEFSWYQQPPQSSQQAVFYGFSSSWSRPALSFVNISDANSPFAKVLSLNIGRANKKLFEMFELVRQGVSRETSGQQIPQSIKVFLGEYYLSPTSEYKNDLLEKFSLAIFGGRTCVKNYVNKFPAGPYTTSARQWLLDHAESGSAQNTACQFPIG